MGRYGFDRGQMDQGGRFADMMGQVATMMDMSLRDVERAVALYSLAQPIRTNGRELAWPIAVKLRKPELYARLVANEPEAHTEAIDLLKSIMHRSANARPGLELFLNLHSWIVNGAKEQLAPPIIEPIREFSGPRAFMTWAFESVDLGSDA